MKSLSSSINTERQAEQSAWGELIDIYLPKSITTPHGATSVIRITTVPNGVSFFTPTVDPEPSGTQGDAADYAAWPVKRKVIKANSKFANDKLALAVSNVTAEYAGMLSDVDWYNVPVVVRKISLSITSPTASDCVILFIGQIDSAKVTNEQLSFVCSNHMASFSRVLPAENFHARCRWNWADDYCTARRFLQANYQSKTAGSGCTATVIKSSGLTEDTGTAGYLDEAVTADAGTDKISLTAHGLEDGLLVKVAGTTVPGGLTEGRWYFVVNAGANDFQLAETEGGSAIDITSAGSGVTITSQAPYGTDEIDALSDGSISASSEQTGYERYNVKASKPAEDHWRFTDTPGNPSTSVDLYAPHIEFDFGTAKDLRHWWFQVANDGEQNLRRVFSIFSSSDAANWSLVAELEFNPAQTILNGGFAKYTINGGSARYWRVVVRRQDQGAMLKGIFDAVKASTTAAGTDEVDALSNGNITTSNELAGSEGYQVRDSNSGFWALDAPDESEFGVLDWGYNLNGYWQIPDSQAGLANAALKPWIQFDLGSAKALRLWRIRSLSSVDRESIPRLMLFFSSTDAAAWTFESYFELPPTPPGQLFDVLLPNASSARYWRICIRSKWAEALNYQLLAGVRAYTGSRNYWRDGRVTFDAATATAALQGVSRPVVASFNGELQVADLPTAPASGDTFVVERGCGRSFNACAERANTENFGGFDSIPFQTVVRA